MSEHKRAAPSLDPGPSSTMVQVIPSGDLLSISKAEIDVQIATAKAHPRSLGTFLAAAEQMVTVSQEVAETMYYKLPRRTKDGGEKIIEGPSVRFAEVINQNWHNCRAGARVLGTDEKNVISQGVFHDLETNVAISFEIRRRITRKDGTRYDDDMVTVTGAAAAGIAFRNAVLKGIPKMFWAGLYEKALERAKPAAKDVAARRAAAFEAFAKIGIEEAAVLKALGVKKYAEVGADELVKLRGIWNAIKEGSTTAAEVFGPPPIEETTARDAGRKGAKPKPPAPKQPAPSSVVSDNPIISSKEQTEIYNQAIQHGWQVPEQVIAFLKAKYKVSGIGQVRRSMYADIIQRVRKPPAEDVL